MLAAKEKDGALRLGYPGFGSLTLIWWIVGSVAYARHYLQDSAPQTVSQAFYEYSSWLTCFLPWILFSPIVFSLERKYPFQDKRWLVHLPRLALASVPICYTAVIVVQLLCRELAVLWHCTQRKEWHWWPLTSCEICVQVFIYWSTIGGAYVIRSLIQLHQRERETARLALEKAELESSLRQAELETLRMRLNPHFLFNCLQNISILIQQDPKAAKQMLVRLSDLLRSAFRQENSAEVTLQAEIALTRSYVEIERIRFVDRLRVDFSIEPESESALVPAFLLQPLVENAILHGLQGVQRDGLILIRSVLQGEDLVLTITDNGTGLPFEDFARLEPGIGLASTCERLEKMYSGQHSFSLQSLPEGGTEVRVILPFRKRPVATEGIKNEQTAIVSY